MKAKLVGVLAVLAVAGAAVSGCDFDDPRTKNQAIEAMCKVIVQHTTGGAEEKVARIAADAAVKVYGDSEDENIRKIAHLAKDSLDDAKPHTDKMRSEGQTLCADAVRESSK